MQTTKKQKFIGYKTLVDPETGESYPMQMNVLEERDFNFHKVWLQHLVNSLTVSAIRDCVLLSGLLTIWTRKTSWL